MDKELTADAYLSRFMENPSVHSYVIFTNEGIPMRYDGPGMTHRVAVHYTALITGYLLTVRKAVQRGLKDLFPGKGAAAQQPGADGELDHIRLRTSKSTELIVVFHGELNLLVVQRIGSVEAAKSVATADKGAKVVAGEETAE